MFTLVLNTSLTEVFLSAYWSCLTKSLYLMACFLGLLIWTKETLWRSISEYDKTVNATILHKSQWKENICIATSRIQLIINEFPQVMYLHICRISQITPRARENFIASIRTWNFSHHFKISLYHCTHRLIRETKGKLWKFSYSFKKKTKKKNKENKSEELLSKHHSQIMITTESLFNKSLFNNL